MATEVPKELVSAGGASALLVRSLSCRCRYRRRPHRGRPPPDSSPSSTEVPAEDIETEVPNELALFGGSAAVPRFHQRPFEV